MRDEDENGGGGLRMEDEDIGSLYVAERLQSGSP